MLHTFEYKEFGSLLTLKSSFNYREIIHLHENIYNHPNLDKSCYFIVDATDVIIDEETLDVPLVVSSLDRVFARYKPKMHALFISSNPKLIKLYKEYKNNLAETDWTIKLFATLEEARDYQEPFPMSTIYSKSSGVFARHQSSGLKLHH